MPASQCIRPYTLEDIWQIKAIERETYGDQLCDERIDQWVATKAVFCQALLLRRKLIGYCFYRVQPPCYRLLNFTIAPEFQRKGYGKKLMDRMKKKLHRKTPKMVATVRETDLNFQLFLRSQRFLALPQIFWQHFEDTGEDAYEMEYVHE